MFCHIFFLFFQVFCSNVLREKLIDNRNIFNQQTLSNMFIRQINFRNQKTVLKRINKQGLKPNFYI